MDWKVAVAVGDALGVAVCVVDGVAVCVTSTGSPSTVIVPFIVELCRKQRYV